MEAMALLARNSLQAAGQSGVHRMHRPDSRSRNIHRVGRMSDDAFYERDRDRTRHVQIDCPCRHDFRRSPQRSQRLLSRGLGQLLLQE